MGALVDTGNKYSTSNNNKVGRAYKISKDVSGR